MPNFTAHGNYTVESCQTNTLWASVGVVACLSALNIFLSFTASLGNAVILTALHKDSSIYPPTKLLFRCLAFTDLCVGLVAQPLFAISVMSFLVATMDTKALYYVGEVYYAASFILCEVSVFTSTAISVDRLLAISLGLRYRHVVTIRRIRAVLMCFWLIGISCGSMYFWNSDITFTVTFCLITISLTTSGFSYTKIYLKLRHHQLQLHVSQRHPNGGGFPLNIERYKTTVSSILWVQLALITCYLPFVVTVMLTTYGRKSGSKFEIAFFSTATLTYLNSSLNPILYFWKIRTLRQGVKDTIRQLNCCKSTSV